MIWNKIKEKTELKRSRAKRNQNNKNILKKCLSEITIKNRNKKNNNISSTNDYSTINLTRKKENSFYCDNLKKQPSKLANIFPSSLTKKKAISTKNIFRKKLNKKSPFDKTAKIMETKFYLKMREGENLFGKSLNLFDKTIKSRDKILKKILFDYNDNPNYQKQVLNNTISHYNRNLELLEDQKKVKKYQVLKDSKKFKKLKESNNRKLLISSISKKLSESPSSLHSSPKYKSPPKKRPSIIKDKFEEKLQEILIRKNYYTYKRLKENSKKYCQQVRNLEQDCDLYEPINDDNSKKNILRNNYFSMGNLDRIIKLECLKDERFSYEDYELNSTFLKKCTKEYSFCADKEIAGRYPAFIKKNNFLNRTIQRYGSLQGKYFGIPV